MLKQTFYLIIFFMFCSVNIFGMQEEAKALIDNAKTIESEPERCRPWFAEEDMCNSCKAIYCSKLNACVGSQAWDFLEFMSEGKCQKIHPKESNKNRKN